MRLLSIPRRWRTSALAVLLSVLLPASVAAQAADEADRVRVLLVLDTLDRGGQTWGLDGDNMKAMLERAFTRQGMEKRLTIDMFTGKQAHPAIVLDYYRKLTVGPNDALVFYYSGHGGYHPYAGHFMALKQGNLYREELLQAMSASRPRLVVLLTDCCANFSPRHREPPNANVVVTLRNFSAKPKALRAEPPVRVAAGRATRKLEFTYEPPRPGVLVARKFKPADRNEPSAAVKVRPNNRPPLGPPARREEPPVHVLAGVQLRTETGSVPFKEVLERTDGRILRQLLFRPRGLVDLNGCRRGELSSGLKVWGGSFFTIGFLLLQNEEPKKLDGNGNGIVEWQEFYPALRGMTERVSRATTRGKITQVPGAFQLDLAN